MENCRPMDTPMASNLKLQLDDGATKIDVRRYRILVGSLIYQTNTGPYIVYPVSLVSRFMQEPSSLHYSAAKRILRYLKGTKNHCLNAQKTKITS